ncbi:MAG: hypothetical protein QOC83_6838, partial [Pseudonocardiales bacterium]|nr:hypothetical protein [Pseudonocardiales bacterium]
MEFVVTRDATTAVMLEVTLGMTPRHRQRGLVSTLARLACPYVSPEFFAWNQTHVDVDAPPFLVSGL